MVSYLAHAGGQLFAAEPPVIERLDPPRRAAVLMALLAFLLLGLVLVACVMIGARWVRHLARQRRGSTANATAAENRRLREALHPVLPDGKGDETIVIDECTGDTRADDDRANR
jgi:hypothetical protein